MTIVVVLRIHAIVWGVLSAARCLWGGREAGDAPGLANLSVHLLNAVMLLLELSLNRMVRSIIYLLLSCQLTAPH